jgi:acetyl-CoA acetyltransferase
MKLCLRAIVAACDDAGIDPRDVDGFVSYGAEHNTGPQLMRALGTRELRWSSLVWNGGGGGMAGAIGLAAAAIATGQAQNVVVYRAMAESDGGRLRTAVAEDHFGLQYTVNGLDSPAQICALRTQRLLEADGIPRSAMRAMARAAYFHAQQNPSAVGNGTVLDEARYEASRWVSEPYRLFDCSRENDGAACVLLTSATRAHDLSAHPAYVLAAPMGSPAGWGDVGESVTPYTSAGFGEVAQRVWRESGYGPHDVAVAQIYENFTGPGVAAVIDHGFCTAEQADEFFVYDNLIAPSGRLPINTSGGNLADGFVHGMGLVLEAVRQLRGDSCNQVPSASLSLVTGGPTSMVASSALLGSEETL